MIETNPPGTAEAPTLTMRASARWGQLIVWAAILGLLSAIGWKLWQSGLGQVSAGAAPDFTLTTFDGQTLRLSDLRGQAVVINFWASWCIPCRTEAPMLEAVWREYRDRGVVFVGIAYLDDDTAARDFIAEFNLTYPNGPDLGTRIAPLYRIKGIPETFFCGPRRAIARGIRRPHLGSRTAPTDRGSLARMNYIENDARLSVLFEDSQISVSRKEFTPEHIRQLGPLPAVVTGTG